MKKSAFLAALLLPLALPAFAQDPALELGTKAIHSMAGCYLVDYSYTETEALQPGYQLDKRVYDVNKDKSIKEWIYVSSEEPGKIRLQHILFATDLQGRLMDGTQLRHQAEDWEFDAPFLYDFISPSHWDVKSLSTNTGLWTRRITNLDDGLRYQCAAAWNGSTFYPEWSCDDYAPIPGREYRDMGRKDYNTLERSSRVMTYGNSWLERQNNTKIIYKDGVKTPLAKELGKNWYVRLPDSECSAAKDFVAQHQAFWDVMRDAWASVLVGDRPFVEVSSPSPAVRYGKIMDLEEQYPDLSTQANRQALKQAILNIIQQFRAN